MSTSRQFNRPLLNSSALASTHNSNTVANIFTTGGNVGIGTTSPNNLVTLQRAYNATGMYSAGSLNFMTNNGTNYWLLGAITSYVSAGDGGSNTNYPGGLAFSTKPADGTFNIGTLSTRMVIDASGNVGINTTMPDSALSLGQVGSITEDVNSSYFGANFNTTGGNYRKTGNYANMVMFDTFDGAIKFRNAATGNRGSAITWNERMRITSAGNVGIGTTNPSGRLHIWDNSTGGSLRLTGLANNTASNTGIFFSNDDQLALSRFKSKILAVGNGFWGQSDLHFCLNNQNNSNDAELSDTRMIITKGGNVGIGTTSPTGPLTIASGNNIITNLTVDNYWRTQVTAGNATVSIVYNYQSGKNVYWGESGDTGSYIFRGRGVSIEGGTGTSSPLYVVAGQNYSWPSSGYYFTNAVTVSYAGSGFSETNSILAVGGVTSNKGFYATSDMRIKNIKDEGIDTNLIDLLNPVQFTYKDILQQGTLTKFGFIAQNVQEYIPGAISIRKDTIPDIFKKCNIDHLEGKIHVHLENHNLKNDDNIKVMVDHQDRTGRIVAVINVVDENTFVVDLDLPSSQTELFIYGREVDDLLDVDYNIMSTLAFAGIKELRQKNRDLETKYQNLETKYNQLLNFIQNKFPGEII